MYDTMMLTSFCVLSVAVVVLAWRCICTARALDVARAQLKAVAAPPDNTQEKHSPHVFLARDTDTTDLHPTQGAADTAFVTDLLGQDTKLDEALMATRDGLWDWDRETDELHFNARFLAMLGYTADDFPRNQDTWRALLHPDDRQQAQNRQQQVLDAADSGDTFEQMFRLRAADGSYRWFLGQILHVRRDSDGRAIRVVGANVDITDIKTLQEKVEASGVDVHSVLSATCDKAWEWDLAGNFAGPDAACKSSCLFTMLGRARNEGATGFSLWARQIHPEDKDLAVALQMRIIQTAENGDSAECTYRYGAADGGYRWMLGRTTVMQRDSNGHAIRMVGVHTDVTELKDLRSELEVRNERLHYAFAAARDGLWDWDAEKGSLFLSARYLSMMGYEPETFAAEQSNWEKAVHPEDRIVALAHQERYMSSPDSGDSFENVYRFRAADGTYRWILARALVVRRDAQGRGLRLVGLHTDITEMRRTQETLRILLQHDSLTGLHSRAFFEARVANMRSGEHDPVSMIICDVDGLKLVNDNLGHTEGDHLLLATAGILGASVRKGDVVARIGGDEIAVLLPSCTEGVALRVAGKIMQALQTHNKKNKNIPLSFSMGWATATLAKGSVDQLFRQADAAMLRHKSEHREEVRDLLRTWLHTHTGRLIDTGHDCRTGE